MTIVVSVHHPLLLQHCDTLVVLVDCGVINSFGANFDKSQQTRRIFCTERVNYR